MSTGRMLVAAAIGIAFGWALERAGLGSARKLSGQFYLRDLTVLKVMFSAIVTAMLGVFWLGRLGLLDVSSISVPETFLMPQVAGGLLFGAGLLVAGLCPGTSCVAAATGRGDGVAAVAGLLCGMFATGLAFAPLEPFYRSSARGVFTLPQALGLSYGVLVFVVTVLALMAFVFADRHSARSARAGQVPSGRPSRLVPAALALAAAALAAVAGVPRPEAPAKAEVLSPGVAASPRPPQQPIRRRGC